MYLTDVHSHILHNIDDGSPNLDTSIELLEASFEQGVRKIVLTPHFDFKKYSIGTFLTKRKNRFLELKDEIEKRKIKSPKLYLGAEVSLTTDISVVRDVEKLAFENTNYILIEMPYNMWQNWMYDSIFNLMTTKDLVPIMAHIERYFESVELSRILDLAKMDLYFQINASSVVNKNQFKHVLKFINNNLVYFLGSDAHDPVLRPSLLKQAIDILEKRVSKEYAHFLTVNASLMLDNKMIDRAEELEIPKGNMRLWDKIFYSSF